MKKSNSYHLLNQRIKNAWDQNVSTRALDLEKATDITYTKLIMPWVIEKVLSNSETNISILDIGCGCGYLSNAIYNRGYTNIQGIDISPESIRYAQRKYPHITFYNEDICNLCSTNNYDLCLAIMVLNNMQDLEGFFEVIQNLISPGGKFIVVLPHPCVWPNRHLKGCEFSYLNEKPYDFSFGTRGRRDYSSNILFFHRTLETYFNCFRKANFSITDYHEIVENELDRHPDIVCFELTYMPKIFANQ